MTATPANAFTAQMSRVSSGSVAGFTVERQETRNKNFRILERNPGKQLEDDAVPVLSEQLGLSTGEIRELRKAFNKFDDDRSFLLDLHEMGKLLQDLGAQAGQKEVERMVRRVDKDENGMVDFIEFLNMMCVMPGYRDMVMEHHTNMLTGLVDHMEERRNRPEGAEPVHEKGVPARAIAHCLRQEIDEADACMELPFTSTLFFIYTLGVMLHMKFWILNSVDYAIVFDIAENANFAFSGIVPMENGRMGHKIYSDVNNIPDFWSWLGIGLVPMLWIEVWDVSEPRANVLAMCANSKTNLEGWGYDPSDAAKTEWGAIFENCPDVDPQALPPEYYGPNPYGMYLYFNRMIGGVRMRAESREPESCPGPNDLVKAAFNAPCFDSDYWLNPDLHLGLKTKKDYVNKPASKTEVLRAGWSQQKVRQELLRLEKEKWLNPAVQKLELSFVTFNGHIDVVTITYVNFFFNRGGHIIKHLESMSLWLHPYHKAWYLYLIDSIWMLMVAKILFTELMDVKSYLCTMGVVRGLMSYIGFWNAIDWISVSSAIQLLVRWIYMVQKIHGISEFMEGGDLSIAGSWASEEDILEYHSRVEDACLYSHSVRRLLAVYLMVISARCFKAFNANRRLAMVTQTLAQAAMDILHFGLVLLAVIMSFVTSGIMLFGEELQEFSHFDRAINTCWRLILGDFDWEGLYSAATRPIAGLWFVSFSILVVQIMLNMFLAVIMDVYTQVKSQSCDAKTLPAQAKEMWYHMVAVMRKEELRRSTILRQVENLEESDSDADENRLVNVEAFCDAVDGLDEKQATSIIHKAKASLDDNSDKDLSLSGAMEKVCTLYEREEKCHYCIEQLMFLCSMIADKVATMNQPAKRQSVQSDKKGDGDSAAGSSCSQEDSLTAPTLPPILAETLERGALGKLENRLRSLTVGREQLLHQAESAAKNLESRVSMLDRQVATLVQESQSIANGTHQDAGESYKMKQGRVTEMNACSSCLVCSPPSKELRQ